MALRDKIYGREVMIPPRKVMVTGRGGSGNARKSISSASATSSTVTVGSVPVSSTLAVSTISGGTSRGSDRTPRARRWSSASNDFGSVINITAGPDEGDGCDLYTISSRSTSTNALSDIPSYISEFTFGTSPNPSAKSRPSTRSSGHHSRLSGQSNWSGRIPKSYSSDSLPMPIPESFDETPVSANSHQEITFCNPFANDTSGSFSGYIPQRTPIELAPFDDEQTPTDPAHATGDSPNKGSKGPRVFRVFRRGVPSASSHTPPSAFFGFPSRLGQSTETLVLRSNSMPGGDNLAILDIRRDSASSTTTAGRSLK